MATAKLSRTGKMALPTRIRAAGRSTSDMKLSVRNRPDGGALLPMKPFAVTRLSDVIGSAGYKGPRKTLRDMEDAVLRGGRKRN